MAEMPLLYKTTTHSPTERDYVETGLTRLELETGWRSWDEAWWRESLAAALRAPGFIRWTVVCEEFDMTVEIDQ
tara:strand:+ start:263 stop:484 length:222 start_codon:yes stop_codon:yes gene_type:complete